mmetsp:Transcript_5725/g.14088  ORF Transcript_5725/g.14088 Transcript_5725/m.14088 type:complete len:207 (+) Transcript_5725:397-1017(+)
MVDAGAEFDHTVRHATGAGVQAVGDRLQHEQRIAVRAAEHDQSLRASVHVAAELAVREDVGTPLAAAAALLHEEAGLALEAAAGRRVATDTAWIMDEAANRDLTLRRIGAVVDAVPERHKNDPGVGMHILCRCGSRDVLPLREVAWYVVTSAVEREQELPAGLALAVVRLHARPVRTIWRRDRPTLAQRIVAETTAPACCALAEVR